jgi:hypothetical protein
MADESNLGFAYEFGNRTACPIYVQIVAAVVCRSGLGGQLL